MRNIGRLLPAITDYLLAKKCDSLIIYTPLFETNNNFIQLNVRIRSVSNSSEMHHLS